ncbi:hypothetical protein EDC04DRAFT_2655234, partial [Pisolithus marmoratus]
NVYSLSFFFLMLMGCPTRSPCGTSSGTSSVISVKPTSDEEAWLKVKSMSFSRMRNVTKAYVWWIAKDACPLPILNVRHQVILDLLANSSYRTAIDFTL